MKRCACTIKHVLKTMGVLYSPRFHANARDAGPCMAWLWADRSTKSSGGVRSGDTHAPQLAYSVEILLHELCARLILQELHLLLELELSDLFLSAKWVLFPCDFVQFQLMLHAIELLLKLELVQLLLRLVQLLRTWLCCETGTGCLVSKLVELPLCLREFLGALEIIKLFALVEFVDVFLLDRVRPLLSEW